MLARSALKVACDAGVEILGFAGDDVDPVGFHLAT